MHSGINSIATDWSSDGRYAVYMANELGTNWNIWAMPLAGNGIPQAVLRSAPLTVIINWTATMKTK
jgi:Tol biopolymer transport system component